jgi:rubrerythrin
VIKGERVDKKEFEQIIEYAIDREKEAVQFYHELQESVHFTERRNLLVNLEHMEKGHVAILEGIRDQDIKKIDIPEIEDLHISEYLVYDKPSGDLSYQDILIIAMKREEASHRLYIDLAAKTTDTGVRKLFLKLASEEARHKLLFEKMYDDEILTEG